MLEALRETLRSLASNDTALWFSGGKDSRLLLEVMIAEDIPFSVLRFDDGWTYEQKKIVDEFTVRYGLRVYSYPPRVADLIGDGGENLSIVADYPVSPDGHHHTIVRDLADGTRCGADLVFNQTGHVSPPIYFKTHIVGAKASDRHYTLGDEPVVRSMDWLNGDRYFIAPLFNWTDDEVLRALLDLGISHHAADRPELDTGNTVACSLCLRSKDRVFCPKSQSYIDPVAWSPNDKLEQFRLQYANRG